MKYENGDRVIYLNQTLATVIRHQKNGVVIEYWGRGLKEGRIIRRRVSVGDIHKKGL